MIFNLLILQVNKISNSVIIYEYCLIYAYCLICLILYLYILYILKIVESSIVELNLLISDRSMINTSIYIYLILKNTYC